MANFTFSRVIDIMRRVVSRRNTTDNLSTNVEFQEYIGEFMRDLMPQEIKTFENFGTYSFNTIANTEDYPFNTGDGADIDGNIFENIGPIAYSDETIMTWYQDPAIFRARWGFDTNVTTVQTSQPVDILFYSDRFTLKPRPDDAYLIRIFGYRRNLDETDSSDTNLIQDASGDPLPENYWGRYIAYGASLDYMYDFGYEASRIATVQARYKHYKALVHSRTFNQFKQNSPIQRF